MRPQSHCQCNDRTYTHIAIELLVVFKTSIERQRIPDYIITNLPYKFVIHFWTCMKINCSNYESKTCQNSNTLRTYQYCVMQQLCQQPAGLSVSDCAGSPPGTVLQWAHRAERLSSKRQKNGQKGGDVWLPDVQTHGIARGQLKHCIPHLPQLI